MKMPKNSTLESLLKEYQKTEALANEAYKKVLSALEERRSARESLNQKFVQKNQYKARYRTIWGAYARLRSYNNYRIDALHQEAKYANDARHAEIEKELKELSLEIRQAGLEAKLRAPRSKVSDYDYAQSRYRLARSKHEKAKKEYARLRKICDHYEKLYLQAKSVYSIDGDQNS